MTKSTVQLLTLRLCVLLVLIARASDAKPPPAQDSSAVAPSEIRWVWISSSEGTCLAYLYTDPYAGVSAKGGVVSEPPQAKQIADVLQGSGGHTFRDPGAMGAQPLTQAEISKLKLPRTPAWVERYEAKGTPAPRVAFTKPDGRPSTAGTFIILMACGPWAGYYKQLDAGQKLTVGSAPVSGPEEERLQLEGKGIAPKHLVIANEGGAVQVLPEQDASTTVNGKTVTTRMPLAVGDRIVLGPSTLIVRELGFSPRIGPDPSCPGFNDRMNLQDGCQRYGRTYTEILGGTPIVVGSAPGNGGYTVTGAGVLSVHATLVAEANHLNVTAADGASLKLNGEAITKAVARPGDRLTVGTSIIVVTDKTQKPTIKTPLPECPK